MYNYISSQQTILFLQRLYKYLYLHYLCFCMALCPMPRQFQSHAEYTINYIIIQTTNCPNKLMKNNIIFY